MPRYKNSILNFRLVLLLSFTHLLLILRTNIDTDRLYVCECLIQHKRVINKHNILFLYFSNMFYASLESDIPVHNQQQNQQQIEDAFFFCKEEK